MEIEEGVIRRGRTDKLNVRRFSSSQPKQLNLLPRYSQLTVH